MCFLNLCRGLSVVNSTYILSSFLFSLLAEVAGLPAEVWILWNCYTCVYICTVCLGWTLLPSSPHCWGTYFPVICFRSCWFIIILMLIFWLQGPWGADFRNLHSWQRTGIPACTFTFNIRGVHSLWTMLSFMFTLSPHIFVDIVYSYIFMQEPVPFTWYIIWGITAVHCDWVSHFPNLFSFIVLLVLLVLMHCCIFQSKNILQMCKSTVYALCIFKFKSHGETIN